MWSWLFRRVDSVVFMLCTKFGSNICYSHRDRRTYHSDLHLMTSCELTFGFDFWSRGPLCMAVMHLPIKFGADIFIQSGVINIFLKFKMAAAANLDFQVMWIRLFRRVDSVVFVFCTRLVQISVIVTEIDALILQTFIWWCHVNRLPVSSFIHVLISAWPWCIFP